MPIYSRSRNTGVVANENYTEHDFGRIMYECAVNDQKVFNAVMVNEYAEMDASQSGTMLESELSAFREFSVKEAWGNMKKLLMKAWEKIKGVFKAVFAKITVFLVRDGKAIVKLHQNSIKSKSSKDLDKCKMPKLRLRQNDLLKSGTKVDVTVEKALADSKNDKDNETIIADLIHGEGDWFKNCDTIAEMNKTYMDYCFNTDESTDLTFGKVKDKYSISYLAETLQNGGDAIKAYKKLQTDNDKAFKAVIKVVDKEAKKDKDSDYGKASKYVRAFQSVRNAAVAAYTSALKFEIKQCHKIWAALATYPVHENAYFAVYEAAAEFDEVMDDTPASEVEAPDVQEAIAADPQIQIIINTDDAATEVVPTDDKEKED